MKKTSHAAVSDVTSEGEPFMCSDDSYASASPPWSDLHSTIEGVVISAFFG